MLPGRAVELPLFLRLLPERAVVRLAQVGATARVPELEVREDRLHLRGGERARCGLAAAHDRTDLGLLLLGHRGGEFGGDTKAFAWGGGGRKFTILGSHVDLAVLEVAFSPSASITRAARAPPTRPRRIAAKSAPL